MSPDIYAVKPAKVNINMLLYGYPGVGKTTFAATAQDHPDLQDALFLNVEGGLLSVVNRGDISAIDITCTQDVEDSFWQLAKKENGFDRFQTVVIDSGSELQTLNLENIVAQSIKKKGTTNRERDSIYQEDYGTSTTQLKRLFRWFRDLPINVIVTALPKEVFPAGVQDTPPEAVKPYFTTKLCESVMGYMDFVWYLYHDETGTRKLLTQPHGIYTAKTRGVAFPEAIGKVIENPTLPAVYDLLIASECGSPKAKKGAKK